MFYSDDDEQLPGWAAASLRIASENYTADAVSDALGLKPTSTRESEGEPTFTVWMFESKLAPTARLEDHLYILMETLRGRETVLTDLAESETVELWLSFSSAQTFGSSILNHTTLKTIGELGIDLVLDQYK